MRGTGQGPGPVQGGQPPAGGRRRRRRIRGRGGGGQGGGFTPAPRGRKGRRGQGGTPAHQQGVRPEATVSEVRANLPGESGLTPSEEEAFWGTGPGLAPQYGYQPAAGTPADQMAQDQGSTGQGGQG